MNTINSRRGRIGWRKVAFFSATSVAALQVAAGAAAQTTALLPPADDAAKAEDVGAVVVTASRITRQGFTAPTPVTTIGAEQLQRQAPTTLGDVLQNIPSFRATTTLGTSGVNSRGGGQVTADLRGLGATRTLVLVNGRRFVPSTAESTVDLKLVPTLLVNSVEVVTGGASAAWGSDAVAGVVNFILKDRIDGIQGTVQYGQSKYNDAIEYRASLAAGGTFADGKLRIIAGADFIDNSGVSNQYTRDWGRREVGVIVNPNFATNGLPNYIITPDYHSAVQTQGGLINAGPLRGTAFGPGGAPYQFQFGQVFGTTMIGGTREGQVAPLGGNLGSPVEAITSMGKIDYTFSDKLSAFAEFNLAWSKTGGASDQPRDAALTIRQDNAYLPASVRAQMVALGLQTVTVGRVNDDTGPVKLETQDQTYRAVVGLKGELGGGWTWDAYYQWGRNRYALRFGPNNRNQPNWLLEVDAVRNPTTGAVVCRSSLTNPSNGCVPENIFGNGSATLNSFAFGTATFDLVTEQQVAAVNLQGEPIRLPAGPVSIAVGGEWRQEKALATPDALSLQAQPNGSVGAWAFGNQGTLNGKYNVKEIYAETVVPIVHDAPFARALDLNGAVRHTDYSISGKVTTWKAGFTWQATDDLRLRGTLSRDIRAPNLSELFQGGTGSSFTNVFDPVVGGTVQIRQVGQGNPNLKPEVAKTKTLGLAYQPSWMRRLALSVDYYSIRVNDVIGSVGAATIANGCFAGNQALCPSIVFNPDKSIAYIISSQLNLSRVATSGVDIEAQYTLPLSSFSRLSGDLSLRVLLTYVDKLVTTDPSGTRDRVGQLGALNRVTGVPHWSGNTDIVYRADRWQVNLQTRWVGPGLYSTELREGCCAANTIADNSVAGYVLFNLGAQYNFKVLGGRDLQVFGTINNLLDRAPPYLPSGALGGANESSVNPVFYDAIGRAFKVGLRFKY